MLCLSLEHPVMSHLSSFPILVFVLVAYLGIAALGGMMLDGDALTISLASGAEMTLRGGDLFVAGGLVALTIDLAKMSRGGRLGHVVRAVAFVALEPVTRNPVAELHHQPVARHLGDDRRGGE